MFSVLGFGSQKPHDVHLTEYLVIAGGGGAGSGISGGGGAGGYRTASGLYTRGTNVITVGAGGDQSDAGSSDAMLGGDSVFSSITSVGGGYGAGFQGAGADGGSGGGVGGRTNALDGGSGTANQGNDGGDSAASANALSGGGGGGGAGAAGGPNRQPSGDSDYKSGGNGGAGLASSITGSSVTRAGGGGGGIDQTPGNGGTGSGGGGDGAGAGTTKSAGTANTGGGGGGGGTGNANGMTGGSGVVILKILASEYSGTVTGSPNVANSGDYKILTYNGSGTYTTTR